jgi:hypothetical protein
MKNYLYGKNHAIKPAGRHKISNLEMLKNAGILKIGVRWG